MELNTDYSEVIEIRAPGSIHQAKVYEINRDDSSVNVICQSQNLGSVNG